MPTTNSSAVTARNFFEGLFLVDYEKRVLCRTGRSKNVEQLGRVFRHTSKRARIESE